jgi:hypothetical protein
VGRSAIRRLLRLGAATGAVLALAAPPALGQVVIGGGAGIVYGPWVPIPFWPGALYGPWPGVLYAPAPYVLVDPWVAAPLLPRDPETWPSCYRYGRCSAAEIARYRHRVDRLERLAPSAPADPQTWEPYGWRAPLVPPTPEENIHPEYRGASVVREEYAGSGRPVEPAKPD